MSEKRIQVMWDAVEDADDEAYDGRSFQAGAASRDAEVAELREELESAQGRADGLSREFQGAMRQLREEQARIARVEALRDRWNQVGSQRTHIALEITEAFAVPVAAPETTGEK